MFHFAGFEYDVSPDGRQILIGLVNDANTKPITIVTNWTAGLKQ